MDIMIKDAENKIQDKVELEAKVTNIKENQLLGVEIVEMADLFGNSTTVN